MFPIIAHTSSFSPTSNLVFRSGTGTYQTETVPAADNRLLYTERRTASMQGKLGDFMSA